MFRQFCSTLCAAAPALALGACLCLTAALSCGAEEATKGKFAVAVEGTTSTDKIVYTGNIPPLYFGASGERDLRNASPGRVTRERHGDTFSFTYEVDLSRARSALYSAQIVYADSVLEIRPVSSTDMDVTNIFTTPDGRKIKAVAFASSDLSSDVLKSGPKLTIDITKEYAGESGYNRTGLQNIWDQIQNAGKFVNQLSALKGINSDDANQMKPVIVEGVREADNPYYNTKLNVIRVKASSILDTSVLLHEYGHTVFANHFGEYEYVDKKCSSKEPGVGHHLNPDRTVDEQCAFIEGWADFFAIEITSMYKYIKDGVFQYPARNSSFEFIPKSKSGQGGKAAADLDFSIDTYSSKPKNEGHTAAILFRLHRYGGVPMVAFLNALKEMNKAQEKKEDLTIFKYIPYLARSFRRLNQNEYSEQERTLGVTRLDHARVLSAFPRVADIWLAELNGKYRAAAPPAPIGSCGNLGQLACTSSCNKDECFANNSKTFYNCASDDYVVENRTHKCIARQKPGLSPAPPPAPIVRSTATTIARGCYDASETRSLFAKLRSTPSVGSTTAQGAATVAAYARGGWMTEKNVTAPDTWMYIGMSRDIKDTEEDRFLSDAYREYRTLRPAKVSNFWKLHGPEVTDDTAPSTRHAMQGLAFLSASSPKNQFVPAALTYLGASAYGPVVYKFQGNPNSPIIGLDDCRLNAGSGGDTPLFQVPLGTRITNLRRKDVAKTYWEKYDWISRSWVRLDPQTDDVDRDDLAKDELRKRSADVVLSSFTLLGSFTNSNGFLGTYGINSNVGVLAPEIDFSADPAYSVENCARACLKEDKCKYFSYKKSVNESGMYNGCTYYDYSFDKTPDATRASRTYSRN